MKNPEIERYLSEWRNRMFSSKNCIDTLEEIMETPATSEGIMSRHLKTLGYEYLSDHPNCEFSEFESTMLHVDSPVAVHVEHLKTWHNWQIKVIRRIFLEIYLIWKVSNNDYQVFYGSERVMRDKDTDEAHLVTHPSLREMLPSEIVAVKIPTYVAVGFFCAVIFVPGFPAIGLGRRGVVILNFSSIAGMENLAAAVKISAPTFAHAVVYVRRTIKELYT
jgi:hypothetical protein